MADATSAKMALSLTFRLRDCLRILRAKDKDTDKKIVILAGLREYELNNGSPVTMSEISERSGLKLPNVCRLLQPFESDGLVQREKRGRTVYVTVTEEGNAVLKERYGRFLDELQRDIFSALDEQEAQTFLACMEKIVAQFEKKARNQTGESNGKNL